MSTARLIASARVAAAALIAAEDRIEGLDRAIGDGDHFHNMKRGAETVLALAADVADAPASVALKAIAMKLMTTIGGASGPLTSSFFLAASRTPGVDDEWTPQVVAALVADGVAAIVKRGGAGLGDKTMVDVLIPVSRTLSECAAAGADRAETLARVAAAAEQGMLSTRDMRAAKGRAAFLGERAVGHIDPGAMSCFVMIAAICAALGSEGGTL